MAWLVSDAVTLARDLLMDSVTPYRYSDAMLIRFLNHGLEEANRLRPDLFIATSGAVTQYVEADATGSTAWPISTKYVTPLAEYIAGMADLTNDEFATDGRAMSITALFRAALLGVGR